MIPFAEIKQLYIGGEWALPADGGVEDVINPATEEIIAQAPAGSVKDAEAAVAAARDAFDSGEWPSRPINERADIVEEFCREVSARRSEIIDLLIAEAGCPRQIAGVVQYDLPMGLVEWAIEYARRMEVVKNSPLESATSFLTGKSMMGGGQVVREPKGVVTAITPFNYPFYLNLVKIVPALLMGNTMVLKPSPYTPFSALLFGEIAQKVGLPAGVLNIITGDVAASEFITGDRRVDMVTFTGSDAVGAAIMAQAAPTLKDVHLELGGKSAMIVRDDASIAEAGALGAAMITIHAGQGCACLTRHIVHNAVREQYTDAISGALQYAQLGDPRDETTVVGPLIRESARERTERYVQMGLDGGGTLVTGGKRPAEFASGFYYEPTVIDNVDNSSAIAQEEIFGPVAVVIGFDSDEEAVALANDSNYGLFGGIFSGDIKKGYDMALQLRTGGVLLNGGNGKTSGYLPFGGYKRSGIGREYGEGWLEAFSEQKSIAYHIG